MKKERKKGISKELNVIKRIFLEIASRLQSNTAKIKKIKAYCQERREHFLDKWTGKEKEKAAGLPEMVEDDIQKIVLLGLQNRGKILSLIKGKTLKLNKRMSIGYRTGPKILEVLNKDWVIESLKNLEEEEGLDIKDLVTTELTIPKKDVATVISILKDIGVHVGNIKMDINEKALETKIKSGELDPGKLKGLKIIQNEFLILRAPDINFSEPIETTT